MLCSVDGNRHFVTARGALMDAIAMGEEKGADYGYGGTVGGDAAGW